MTIVKIVDKAGTFAENKDIARDLRLHVITPILKNSEDVIVIDFEGVTGATQSFIHALISQLIREFGGVLFARLRFKNCNTALQQVINIVADYMTEL
jgi:hypothetical protein